MVSSEEETLNRMKYEAFTKFVKDEEISGEKGTKAKELIDKMEQYKMMRKYKIHENSAFIKEIEHYEQKIKECREKLDELLGYNR